jgi:hypothetical protein
MSAAAQDAQISEDHRLWVVASRRAMAHVGHATAHLAKPRWGWLGTMMIGVGLLLIYLLVTAWAGIVDAAELVPKNQHAVHWFGRSFRPTSDTALLLLVVLVSALGSYVHAATSFADYSGNGKLTPAWLWWYLLRVFIGCSLAILFYFALRGGFFTSGSQSEKINPYGVAALSGLVGLFSKQATDKLRELFDTAFRVREGHGDDARADGITNPKPALVGIEPQKLGLGVVDLVLHGSGFTSESFVRVLRQGRAVTRKPTFVDAATLHLELKPEDVAAEGILQVAVHTPAPGGGASESVQIQVFGGEVQPEPDSLAHA